MIRAISSLTRVMILVVAATGFIACGGGAAGGGGGGGGGGGLLEILSQPSFGTMGVINSTLNFNTGVASPQSLVGPTNFMSAGAGDANFLELQFSSTVSEASVVGGGIIVRGSDNLTRSYFLDKTGAIDASNAFMGNDAPGLLRLYFEDTANPGVPIALVPDGYNIRLANLILKSSSGESFCVAEQGGTCMLQADSVFYFTLDGQNTPVAGMNAPLGAGPTPALPLPAILKSDDEVRLFFDRDVDFQSVVGFNPATGVLNVTSQDPFCSVPFPVGGGPLLGSNIFVNYTPPAPTSLPPNYGYIVYMPNPFNDASEIRVRFVDTTFLTPFDDPTGAINGTGLPSNQTYGIPSAIWDNALLTGSALTAPSDISTMQNGPFELPVKLPIPGSRPGAPASIIITLASPTSGFATDSSAVIPANADGVMGVTDRARIALGTDIVVARTLEMGSAINNNPEPPDLHLVANGSKLNGFSTAGNTVNANPNGIVTGFLFPIANQLDDQNTLSNVTDVQFGAFVFPGNAVGNPPRRLNNASAIAQGIDPGTPFPPGATPEASFALPGPPPNVPPNPSQPLGARMYVVDTVQNEIKVFNSNTFQPLGIITGISSPRGLGADGQFFYVSNFDQDTITRFGAIPGTPVFHNIVSATSVGAGPTKVTVQPNVEDIGTVNSLDNSISFVDLPMFTERAQFPVGMGPSEFAMTSRWTGMGTTFAFTAFVPNTFSNTVSIFESDSPLLTVPNGPDGKIIENRTGFSGPMNGEWNLALGVGFGLGGQGMYVPNSLGSSVTHFSMTFFNLAPAPGLVGPPPIRTYSTTISFFGTGLNGGPTDLAIDNTILNLSNPTVINSVIAIFPGSGVVASFGANNGILLGTATCPGNEIFGVFDQ